MGGVDAIHATRGLGVKTKPNPEGVQHYGQVISLNIKNGWVSLFGIRGIGSLYYLSYAIYMADFPQSDELWAITIFIVAVSVFVHGVTAKPIMERFAKNE